MNRTMELEMCVFITYYATLHRKYEYVDLKSAGGAKCPPNMSRIIARWGLEERLRSISTRCSRIAFNTGM